MSKQPNAAELPALLTVPEAAKVLRHRPHARPTN